MMKPRWTLVIFAISAGLMFWAMGCADKQDEAVTDQEALQELMQSDSELEQADAFSGEELGGGGGILDEPITPSNWGRFGHRDPVNFNVDIIGDTFATITRTMSFNGSFRILVHVTDTTDTIYSKPMYNTLVRKAHAVRIGNSPNPRRNWRITEVTPMVLVSADPNPHTIEPARVQMYRATDTGPDSLADITNPLDTWFNRASLPRIFPGDSIVIFATASSANPAVAFLHPHVYHFGRMRRLALHDDGVAPDVTANDGIYSGAYTTPPRLGVHLSAVDFLDYETLYDSEAPYDAGAWAIPYRVAEE